MSENRLPSCQNAARGLAQPAECLGPGAFGRGACCPGEGVAAWGRGALLQSEVRKEPNWHRLCDGLFQAERKEEALLADVGIS